MRRLALAVLLTAPCFAQPAFRLSQAALMGSAVADALSSRGMVEKNPLLGRGDFEMRRQGVKVIGFTAVALIAETLLVRRYPQLARGFRYANFAGVGAHGLAAGHNWSGR